MTKQERERAKKEAEYYQLHIVHGCTKLGITLTKYKQLRLLANQLNKLYCRRCNGYTQDYFENKDNERESILMTKIENMTQNLYRYYQTDPRGGNPVFINSTHRRG